MIPESAKGGDAPKWVTFNDLVDDAMEGGKLGPINMRENPDPNRERRASLAASIPISTSISPHSMRSNSVVYMSTSVSSESSFGSVASPPPTLPKPPESQARRKRFSLAVASRSPPPPTEEEESENRPFSLSFNGFDASGGNQDKYSAFSNLKRQNYKGWSTTVMGTGPFGWSEELLNGDNSKSGSEDSGTEEDNNHLKVEEPWYKRSWDTSPSRRFVRNFP